MPRCDLDAPGTHNCHTGALASRGFCAFYDAPGEMMILHHPFDTQIFDGHRVELAHAFVSFQDLDYTLVHMATQQLQALHHCVYSLQFHLVIVTKYRRKGITMEMLERLDGIFRETLEKLRSELIEFNGEEDHVHLLLQTNPTVQLSKLVNNLKTVSSRLIRRDFKGHVNRIYRKRVFWHRSYCLISTGGATIEVLRK